MPEIDGFEFLSMAEAGELCHWEIVQKIAEAPPRNSIVIALSLIVRVCTS